MGNPTFARARRFLNYHPVPKWLAVTCAVGTGIFYVALLVVLALFADLMVARGEIPCWANLSERDRAIFLQPETQDSLTSANVRSELQSLGVTDAETLELAATRVADSLAPRQQEL